MIFLLIILHSTVHIYDFHIFIILQCIKFVVKMASIKNSCIVFVIEVDRKKPKSVQGLRQKDSPFAELYILN